MQNRGRYVTWTLRIIGLLDFSALVAVMAPQEWITDIHRDIGLGEFPIEPIAGYLARSTSFWYASYGMLLWFVSCDLVRYASLITCLALMMVAQGLIAIGIDVVEGMPIWWTALEGPCCTGLGVFLMAMQRWSNVAPKTPVRMET